MKLPEVAALLLAALAPSLGFTPIGHQLHPFPRTPTAPKRPASLATRPAAPPQLHRCCAPDEPPRSPLAALADALISGFSVFFLPLIFAVGFLLSGRPLSLSHPEQSAFSSERIVRREERKLMPASAVDALYRR
ncbi:hypothetical protein AB1Y20_006860 [Prymnesium parvum]|uniref:Uncharacterized protein n=1 Tax=Prymnesium parvum TaxID=97485 RepID=A0AB34IZL5_PRYPA